MINYSGSPIHLQALSSAATGKGDSAGSLAAQRCALFDSILFPLQGRPLQPMGVTAIAPQAQQLSQLQQDGCAHP